MLLIIQRPRRNLRPSVKTTPCHATRSRLTTDSFSIKGGNAPRLRRSPLRMTADVCIWSRAHRFYVLVGRLPLLFHLDNHLTWYYMYQHGAALRQYVFLLVLDKKFSCRPSLFCEQTYSVLHPYFMSIFLMYLFVL